MPMERTPGEAHIQIEVQREIRCKVMYLMPKDDDAMGAHE